VAQLGIFLRLLLLDIGLGEKFQESIDGPSLAAKRRIHQFLRQRM
jgi:hypothetical protein